MDKYTAHEFIKPTAIENGDFEYAFAVASIVIFKSNNPQAW